MSPSVMVGCTGASTDSNQVLLQRACGLNEHQFRDYHGYIDSTSANFQRYLSAFGQAGWSG